MKRYMSSKSYVQILYPRNMGELFNAAYLNTSKKQVTLSVPQTVHKLPS